MARSYPVDDIFYQPVIDGFFHLNIHSEQSNPLNSKQRAKKIRP
jgi:hypothetical protein